MGTSESGVVTMNVDISEAVVGFVNQARTLALSFPSESTLLTFRTHGRVSQFTDGIKAGGRDDRPGDRGKRDCHSLEVDFFINGTCNLCWAFAGSRATTKGG